MKNIKLLSAVLVLVLLCSSCYANKPEKENTTTTAANTEAAESEIINGEILPAESTTAEVLPAESTTSVFERYHTGISVFSEAQGVEILAEAVSSEGMLYLYEKTENGWEKILGTTAKFGQNGMSYDMYEGNRCTPLGLYKLDTPFGIQDAPEGVDDYLKVTDSMYWVDDPDSKYYNQLFDTSKNDDRDWNSAEHLIDYERPYAYGMVIEVNVDPIVPGVTSAIFLHCGENETLGCVAVPRDDMVKILQLTNGKTSYILIR